MVKKNNSIFTYFTYIILFLIFLIFCYGYNSGSCQIKQDYPCDNNFCLYKEFDIFLNNILQNDVNKLLENKSIQKRVNITMYPENIFNCAIPNKKGITISTKHIIDNCPKIIEFYQNELCDIISKLLKIKVTPTSLELPTSCAILIYENENDWINWHYDYNYYNGRFFTVLIPVTNNETCTKFEFKNEKNEIVSKDIIHKGICFEGNYLYHRASKLCKNEKRVILSCQFVTDNSISLLNMLRLKLKDFAYTGKIF
jgi:hypothetical protein